MITSGERDLVVLLSLICGMFTVCHGLFVCSLCVIVLWIMALPRHLVYYFDGNFDLQTIKCEIPLKQILSLFVTHFEMGKSRNILLLRVHST